YVTDPAANSIFSVSPSGVVTDIEDFGTDSMSGGTINDLAFDSRGNLFVTFGDTVIEFPEGMDIAETTIASVPGGAGGIAVEPPTMSSAAGSVVGVADFNRDGHPDYLLFNSSTRQTAIWCLNNNVFSLGQFGPTIPAGWCVVGVVDFRRYCDLEFLVGMAIARTTVVWVLSDAGLISGQFRTISSAGWSVVGVADFNRDGHPDYLLFNSSTRQT